MEKFCRVEGEKSWVSRKKNKPSVFSEENCPLPLEGRKKGARRAFPAEQRKRVLLRGGESGPLIEP